MNTGALDTMKWYSAFADKDFIEASNCIEYGLIYD